MSETDLKQSIAELRHEITQVSNDATRSHLEELLSELEAHFEASSTLEAQGLSGSLTRWIEQYEVEHPKITNLLNQMMTSLSNMGI